MPLIFSEPPFELSIGLRVLYLGQNWLDTVPFEMLLEIAILLAIFMNAMSTELGHHDP